MEKKCCVCDKIIKGNSLDALETNYNLHMKTHKLRIINRTRKVQKR